MSISIPEKSIQNNTNERKSVKVNVFREQGDYRNQKLSKRLELDSYQQMNSGIMRLNKENNELWELVKKKRKKTRLQLKDKYSLMKQRHAEDIYDSDDNDLVDNIFEQIIDHNVQIKLLKRKQTQAFNVDE